MEAQAAPEAPVNFDRPPVGEVALAVQFRDGLTDDATTLSTFWPQIRDTYPKVEVQPPAPPMSEDFRTEAPAIAFQMVDASQGSRYWFLTDEGSELVQVQPDRLAYNWRKEPGDAEYPRYEVLRERFEGLLRLFLDTAEAREKVSVPTWCEVTYINPIVHDDPAHRPDLSEIVRRIAPGPPEILPSPEDTSYAERFRLEREGKPVGRFYINASPGVSAQTQESIYLLTLTARGMPITPDQAGAIAFLDYGRDLIVRTFREITTPAMHEKWGLR